VVEALAKQTAEQIDSLDLDDRCLYVMIVARGQSPVAEADQLRAKANRDNRNDYLIEVIDDFVVVRKSATALPSG
jgi:hypothetical protein